MFFVVNTNYLDVQLKDVFVYVAQFVIQYYRVLNAHYGDTRSRRSKVPTESIQLGISLLKLLDIYKYVNSTINFFYADNFQHETRSEVTFVSRAQKINVQTVCHQLLTFLMADICRK